MKYRVEKIIPLTAEIFQVFLLPKTANRLKYNAGQYLKIRCADDTWKPFSIANAPVADGVIELHIRHTANNLYTQRVMNEIATGEVEVQGAFGTTALHSDWNGPYLFLAGGTGLAPIKALLEEYIKRATKNNSFLFPVYLYWGVSKKGDFYLKPLLEQWQRQFSWFHYVPVLSHLQESGWKGRTGLVHNAVLEDLLDLSTFCVYAAGPPPMVQAAFKTFQVLGLKPELFYCD